MFNRQSSAAGVIGRPAKPGETPNRVGIPTTQPKGTPVQGKPPASK